MLEVSELLEDLPFEEEVVDLQKEVEVAGVRLT